MNVRCLNLLIPVAAGLLAGCASAPDPVAPELAYDLPASFAAADASGTVIDGWLSAFDDPALEHYVRAVMANNLDLRAAASRVEAARQQAIIGGAGQYPTVTAGISRSRSRTNLPEPRAGQATTTRSTSYAASVDLSWEIDVWGRLSNAAAASLADFEAAQDDFEAARLSLAATAVQAWFDATTARLQRDLAEETLRSFEDSRDLIQRRYDRGLSESLDLSLSLANVANARALLEQRQRELLAARRTMEVLLNAYPDASTLASEDLPPLIEAVPPGLPSEMLTRRPDIRASERRLAAAGERAQRAAKDRYPRLTLTGSVGGRSPELSDVLRAEYWVWSILAGLSAPIFNGGELDARMKAAQSEAEQALFAYAAVVLDAFREVEQALASEELLAAQEAALAEASEESGRAEELARERYARGVVDIITVLETQRRALDARADLISARNQRLQNRVNLYLALGGDFATEPSTR